MDGDGRGVKERRDEVRGVGVEQRPRLASQVATWLSSSTAPVRRVASGDLVTRWGRQAEKKEKMALLLKRKLLNSGLERQKKMLA